IVKYLDQAYPDIPRLITPGMEVLLATLHALVLANTSAPLYAPIASRIVSAMDEDSDTVYRGRVERAIGMSIEEFLGTSGEEDKYWAKAKNRFGVVDSCIRKAALAQWGGRVNEHQPYLAGEERSYADLIVVAPLLWAQKALNLGENYERWKQIAAWNGGRWCGCAMA
ncbi:hypothetical protein DFP72DRAFT_810782, partial [Ephemerocybe angulata]